MKITRIKCLKANVTLEEIAADLRLKIADEGFITKVRVVNSSRIDLGMHMKSFVIDTKIHGYNTRHNPHSNPKRSSTPSWTQRVTYNNIINKCLDKYNISANIKSGPFTIRLGTKSFIENDWYDQKPEYLYHNESRGYLLEEGFDEDEAKKRKSQAAKARREAAKQPLKDQFKLSIVS
jgi:hypothetical protein